ncbi:hypothetical protein KJ992_02020, partial [Patescibacteria group bacterium]|nr:hypothetical protein [Patescibacteria group bacterium]
EEFTKISVRIENAEKIFEKIAKIKEYPNKEAMEKAIVQIVSEIDAVIPKLGAARHMTKLVKQNVIEQKILIEGSTEEKRFVKDMELIRDNLLKINSALEKIQSKSSSKENYYKAINKPLFLQSFQNFFNPASNDMGQALSLMSGLQYNISSDTELAEKERIVPEGYKAPENIGGEKTAAPYEMETEMKLAHAKIQELPQPTKDPLADAMSIFANQFAVTIFKTLMRKFAEMGNSNNNNKKSCLDDNSCFDDLEDYEGQDDQGGITDTEERLRDIITPVFSERADYNILAELTICPDPTKAGPTNCVLDDNFRTAISERMLVGEAMKQGYLNANKVFGFDNNGIEPLYKEGYPYRSMLILKKFRILPVGWELAAQYIAGSVCCNKTDCVNGMDKDHCGIVADEQITLGDVVACFADGDEDSYTKSDYSEEWCKGLVDPTWVLKAPLNYCAKKGFGPEILTQQIAGEGKDSKLMVYRNSEYCADEQSCIKERSDGTCEKYGYCVEDKRTWNFGKNSCDAKYNTCQSFMGDNGKSVSYLENTLQYCTSDQAGCNDYCADYDYENEKWTCDNKFYFNGKTQECSVENEGCHEFIRTKPGTGTNLLANASFENENETTGYIESNILDENLTTNMPWSGFGIGTTTSNDGFQSLQLNKPLEAFISITILDGEKFALSFYSKNCDEGGEFSIQGSNFAGTDVENLATSSLATSSEEWEFNSVTYTYPNNAFTDKIGILINKQNADEDCMIDGIKLERGNATAYSDYGKTNLVYEKMLPDYLTDICQSDNPPTECANFVQACSAEEAGCELYTSADNKMKIAAKTSAYNYCPKECNGYDMYIQEETVFENKKDKYFIPNTAQKCSASAVGCDEFTNLDKMEQGGESKEYYSYIRQCVKANNSDCAEFYTWEGDNESGYQLRSHILQKNLDISTTTPKVTEDDSLVCYKGIYSLPPTDPSYDSDCREFYNKQGEISYHLYSRTITCSDNCQPYRRTNTNINTQITDQSSCGNLCSAADGDERCWDVNYNSGTGGCVDCKNSGKWNVQHQACIYDAIPGEGRACSANQIGCREYSGNTGNNTRMILNNDFESIESIQNWQGINGDEQLNNTALTAGGHSLFISSSATANVAASTTLGNLIDKTSNYSLSFLFKPNTATGTISIYFTNNTDNTDNAYNKAFFNVATFGYDWNLYQVSLDAKFDDNHKISADESLIIEANGSFYIDNIRLTEIVDRYYLIKDSWLYPVDYNNNSMCDWDLVRDAPELHYSLGCSAYQDREKTTHFLRGFTSLCKDTAVGCELMIDTHNYSNYQGNMWHDASSTQPGCQGDDCVEIKKDNFIYAVFDSDKQCNQQDKGCQLLGSSYRYDTSELYSNIYLKNNPDEYDKILCEPNDVGCKKWGSSSGSSYFKDPGDMVCEWEDDQWLKKEVKKCVGTENVCLSYKDCEEDVSCEIDKRNAEEQKYKCSVDELKTIGLGGSPVEQPDNNWAGVCPAEQAGCTEYIDPISKHATNMILNSDFSQMSGSFPWYYPAHWYKDIIDYEGCEGLFDCDQNIKLEKNTLYILAVEGNNTTTIATTSNIFYELDSNNRLTGPVSAISVVATTTKISKRFYVDDNGFDGVINVAAAINSNKVELKKALINYQLKQNLDKAICHGKVDFEKGCVLFNERAMNASSGLAELTWDADRTVEDGSGVAPETGDEDEASKRDSNNIIKVTPDRICDKWLDCENTINIGGGQSVCSNIKICDKFTDSGDCDNWLTVSQENQTYDKNDSGNVKKSDISNMTGYVKVGYEGVGFGTSSVSMYPNDYYPLGTAESVGLSASVPNGGFENIQYPDYYDEITGKPMVGTNTPAYWEATSTSFVGDISAVNGKKFVVIYNPVGADTEHICYKKDKLENCLIYAPEGRNFLKLTSGYGEYVGAVTESGHEITVATGSEYIISAYINTEKLSNGKAEIRVEECEAECEEVCVDEDCEKKEETCEITGCAPVEINPLPKLDKRHPWTFKLGKFRTGADSTKIRIYLQATNSPQGDYYFDDVKIKPALQSKDNWLTSQSCRVYPRQDSLSCDYIDDSGSRAKGWYGHCLEYDRYPGDTDACLLWWSVPGGGTSRLNEWCGDGYVNGQEDCECSIKGEYDCSIAGSGTNYNNQ